MCAGVLHGGYLRVAEVELEELADDVVDAHVVRLVAVGFFVQLHLDLLAGAYIQVDVVFFDCALDVLPHFGAVQDVVRD